jgi:ATP-dependent Clp protease ATP-binding subunit ClpA
VSRINRELQLTLEAAFREARSRRHAYLTVEHLLYALAFDASGAKILRNVGANLGRLKQALERFFDDELDKSPEDEPIETAQTLAFHRVVQSALQHADAAEKPEVEAGDLVAAILQEPDSHAVALLRAQGITRLDVLRYVSHGISKLPGGEGEEPARREPREGEALGDDESEIADPLEAFATDLTARASEGKLDPLIGRDAELERTIHILARRRKNNPILVGESGVGKTAIAEGLALRIHAGQVPDHMQGAEIFALDLGAMLAGIKYRGDFEARFKALVAAVRARENPVLFIDEIHTLLGAGAAQGAPVDPSNMLKPLLRHFERDRALARRFQRIDINEPSIEETTQILQGLAPRYEEHHGVRYSKAALRAAAELSARHLHDRFLPDKAIDVIDEVGAALRTRGGTDQRKKISARDVEQLVARMARIPIAQASTSDRRRLENLADDLKAVVYGQDAAIETLAKAVKRARAGLAGAERPIGSFLFMGPTGVGKTELAKQLANCLGVPFLRFDMSEYMEKHAVARLIGAPPGYVGYDQGGILVDGVRKNPYAVLLLDEIEKAHPDLFDLLLQVMDHARLTDNHGREADFRHVTLIMTSNVGARDMTRRAIGFGNEPAGSGRQELERLFSPEFRNRLDEVVTFAQLTPQVMNFVVEKFVREVESQLREKKVKIELSPAARAWLADAGYDPLFGARPLGRVIQTELKDKIADELLFGSLARGGRVRVDVADRKLTFAFEGGTS